MGLQKYLILHRSEWERIKKPYQSRDETLNDDEHLKSMHELSQKWIKSWPDTVEGHVVLFNKNESLNRKKHLAEIKKFALRKKKDDSAVVLEKARQQLFNNSCYGRQLISCLIESKTLEERDAQVKFKNKLKMKAVLNENEIITKQKQQIEEAEIIEQKRIEEKKNYVKEIAEINKAMHEMLTKKRTHNQEIQKRQELENLYVIKKILDDEKQYEIEDKFNSDKYVCQENIKYNELKNKIGERRNREQEQVEQIEKVWRNSNERMACKMKLIQEKKKTDESLKKQKIYDNLEMIKKDENSKYNEFVEKGIRRLETKVLDKETETAKRKHIQRQEFLNSNQSNTNNKEFAVSKKIEPELNDKPEKCPKFCISDRQTLLCKSSVKKQKDGIQKDQQSLEILTSSKSLVENLRRREEEPSPWSGTELAHQQFAKYAGRTLEECRYKTMALKVIDNYRKDHLLVADSSSTNC